MNLKSSYYDVSTTPHSVEPPPPTHTPSLKDGEVDLEILGENALERKHLLYLLHHYFHSGSLAQEDLLEEELPPSATTTTHTHSGILTWWATVYGAGKSQT